MMRKEKDRTNAVPAPLAQYDRKMRGGRLFNGYVLNPFPMVFFNCLVITIGLGMSILCLYFYLTQTIPTNLETRHVQVNELRADIDRFSDQVYFDTDAGTLQTHEEYICDYDTMVEEFIPGSFVFFSAPIDEPGDIWAIRFENGQQYLTPEGKLALIKRDYLIGSVSCAIVALGLFLLAMAGIYVLSNAPRYPRLSLFFVKKSSLNTYAIEMDRKLFEQNHADDTQK